MTKARKKRERGADARR